MAITKVLISNLALTELGLRSITSLTELNERARKCNLIFDTTVEEVLRAHDWNFARKEVALAIASGETVTGWDYVYAYPSNCLMLRKLFNTDTYETTVPIPYEEMNSSTNTKVIATNIELAYAKFTAVVTDVSVFDASFVKALSYKLAADMAVSLCGDQALADDKLKKYSSYIDDAKRLNKSETIDKPDTANAYIDARA